MRRLSLAQRVRKNEHFFEPLLTCPIRYKNALKVVRKSGCYNQSLNFLYFIEYSEPF